MPLTGDVEFPRDGVLNVHSKHYWKSTSLHGIIPSQYQRRIFNKYVGEPNKNQVGHHVIRRGAV
jgi:hypothetical protein